MDAWAINHFHHFIQQPSIKGNHVNSSRSYSTCTEDDCSDGINTPGMQGIRSWPEQA